VAGSTRDLRLFIEPFPSAKLSWLPETWSDQFFSHLPNVFFPPAFLKPVGLLGPLRVGAVRFVIGRTPPPVLDSSVFAPTASYVLRKTGLSSTSTFRCVSVCAFFFALSPCSFLFCPNWLFPSFLPPASFFKQLFPRCFCAQTVFSSLPCSFSSYSNSFVS